MKASADEFSWSRAQKWTLAARASKFDLQRLAQHFGVTVRQVNRYFQEELGRKPGEWLNEQRMIAATVLLRRAHSVKHVAMELGFKQTNHFCRQFKKLYGMTPSEFMALQQRVNGRPPSRGVRMSRLDH